MPSPFPGMDPYLEDPALWPALHSRFVIALADAIVQTLPPAYYAEIASRTYRGEAETGLMLLQPGSPPEPPRSPTGQPGAVVARSDAAVATAHPPQTVQVPIPRDITEQYLEIRDGITQQVITVLELLSPAQKQVGSARTHYLQQRQQILSSGTHLVELDLLRNGQPMPLLGAVTPSAYRILISAGDRRPQAELYRLALWEALPPLPIPLKAPEQPSTVALQTVLDGIYDRGRYAMRIDYSQPIPAPSLSADEQAWWNAQTAAPQERPNQTG